MTVSVIEFVFNNTSKVVGGLLQDTPANQEAGVDFMLTAAHAGDRGAMLYVAKAYESGSGLGSGR